MKLKSKALSEEINIYKKVFKKGGLSEEQFKKIFKQAQQELQAEAKTKTMDMNKSKNYNHGMSR